MLEKIRVMHIVQSAGGVDRYLRSVLKYIDNSKIENYIVCSFDFNREDYADLVSAFIQIEMQREISLKDDFIAIRKIRGLIKKYRPDVVYAHSSKAGALGRIADIGINNKVIYNPHGWAFNMQCSHKKQVMYKIIEKFLSHFTDKIVCISDAEKESAKNKGIAHPNKLQVILNGIDIEESAKSLESNITRADIGIPENAYVIGTVGRLSKQKSPDIFIRTAKIIKEAVPHAFFLMVGEGEMRKEVENFALENGFANSLMITGWVSEPMKYVKMFDVATLLSRWEGFGLVLPEYMIAGKPIVACNVDAIPEIINSGDNGLLVKPENPEETAKAIISVYRDRELGAKFSDKALSDAKERFDVKRVSAQYEKLFADLMR